MTKTDVAVAGLLTAIVIGSAFDETEKPALAVGVLFFGIVWISCYQTGALQRAVGSIK